MQAEGHTGAASLLLTSTCPLHTRSPILPPPAPQNCPCSAPVRCAFIPAVFCSREATCPAHSPALQTAAGLPSGVSADAATRDPSSAPCPAVWALMSSGSLDCCGSVMLSPQLAGDPSRALPTSGSPPSPTQCPARSTCRAGARCSFSKRRRGLLSGLGSKGHGWQGS